MLSVDLTAEGNAKYEQWRLIVITNALNDHRRLHLLRNPFHEKARGQWHDVGLAIVSGRYR